MTEPQAPNDQRIAIFSLASGRPLLERICDRLGVVPGRHEEREFEDKEHKIRPLERVRGRDVYVVQSLVADDRSSVDDKLTRMLFFLATLRDAGAERITAVAPYLCYARKDRRTKPLDPVTSRYVAALFEAVGIDQIVVIDVHSLAAYENAFRVPAIHLRTSSVFVDALAPLLEDHEHPVVVSPDPGGVKRAEWFREALGDRLGRPVGFAYIEKFRSDGIVRGGTIVGDVDGRAVIILDDLVSTGTTLVRAATSCREHGAQVAYAAATHGVFSADAQQSLSAAELERLFILDTIPPNRLDPGFVREKLEVIDCAPLLAEAIWALHTNGSLAELTG